MTKAIIFDCFGVLVESSLRPFGETFFAEDASKFEQLQILDRQANTGQLSYESFVEKAAELAGITTQEAEKFLDNTPANALLLKYINEELKPKYKIGFLSNASDDWLDDLFTQEQQDLFDDVVLSYQKGIAKPDEEIYKQAAQGLGVTPEQCIFIDDVEAYCEAAEATGMRAIVYEDFRSFRHQLEILL